MRKALIAVALLISATLGVSSASAQTTYTQTNHVCLLYECTFQTPADFSPAASLSYFLPQVFNALNQGKTNIDFTSQYAYWCTGSLTCTKKEYQDFNGNLHRTYNGIDPNCPINDSCWYLNGTFNAGQDTVAKKWECGRGGCGGGNDISGSVTAPSSSAKVIYPCGSDGHDCFHKPGTCWWDGKGAGWKNIQCAKIGN